MSSQTDLWPVHHWQGSAADFHATDLGSTRALWWCEVNEPALILGSTQPDTDIDHECADELGVKIVRRRSGGGVVYVHPEDSVWIDITIGRDDVLWTDDVTSSMLWVGEVFVDALKPWVQATVFREKFDSGTFGRTVCFGSASPGEVFVESSKLVGISQRRTRDGARFQCVMYRRWNPSDWSKALADSDAAQCARSLSVAQLDVPAHTLVDAVQASLLRA